ncbi:MAG: gamma-glutamyl-gamma-aminobutyrate hydrolase family protein [Chitinophagales bacterium]
MIKIGVTAAFEYERKDRIVFAPKYLSYVENDMMRYLSRSGVLPVMIPDVAEDLQKEYLQEMDGFLFQGGTDLAPESYGEKPIGRWKGDIYRDKYEFKIMDFAFQSGKPILGICRGFQLLNAYLGGTLYQDIFTQKEGCIEHRNAELYDKISHEVEWVPGKILAEIHKYDSRNLINTVHHQSVKKLADDLEVLAVSPKDGIIEAGGYKKAKAGKIMGVQWHPEFSPSLGENVVDADILYSHFLEHVRENLKS